MVDEACREHASRRRAMKDRSYSGWRPESPPGACWRVGRRTASVMGDKACPSRTAGSCRHGCKVRSSWSSQPHRKSISMTRSLRTSLIHMPVTYISSASGRRVPQRPHSSPRFGPSSITRSESGVAWVLSSPCHAHHHDEPPISSDDIGVEIMKKSTGLNMHERDVSSR